MNNSWDVQRSSSLRILNGWLLILDICWGYLQSWKQDQHVWRRESQLQMTKRIQLHSWKRQNGSTYWKEHEGNEIEVSEWHSEQPSSSIWHILKLKGPKCYKSISLDLKRWRTNTSKSTSLNLQASSFSHISCLERILQSKKRSTTKGIHYSSNFESNSMTWKQSL